MKKIKYLIIGLVLVVVIGGVSLLKASAQESTSGPQNDLIVGNCVSLNYKLKQLHSSDALLRVNMGQTYESILTKLMNGFNARVANNDFNNSSLTIISDNYRNTLDKFRRDYIVYEEQLSAAINIDCRKQPVSFYDSVMSAREKRNQVHEDVKKLNQYIDEYESAVKKFDEDYKATTKGAE